MKITNGSENEGGTGKISKEIAASLQRTANERHNAAGLGADAVADAASPAGEAIAGIDRLSVRLGLVESADQPASRRELTYLCQALDLRPGARVVDAPCGIGRHALGLARAGCAVTAIDADPEAIAEARRAASHPAIDYRLADLAGPRILADGSQDAIASLYSCIGHGNRPARDLAILANFGAALAPGAVLVVGLANRDVALAGGEREAEFRHKSETIRRRDRPDPDTGLLERDFAIVSADGRREELSETWRYYGYAEMTDMLARAGLALVACHGDFAAHPGDPARDPHLLYLCRRSAA